MRPIRSVRTRLLLVVVAAVALALTAATIGFNLLIANSTDGTETSTLRQRAHDERELLRVVDGAPAPTERTSDPLGDTRIWIFAGDRTIEAPRAHPTTALFAKSLASGPSRFVTIPSTDERLFSLPIVANGRRVGTIVTGISLSPYEQTKRSALIASLAFAATVLGIAVAAAAWLLRSALRPVGLMTQQAETWSEQDLDRRFGFDDPHDELTRLGFTLDRLLDRIAASLRHERRFSAELSHELRTPLAKLTAETELALRRPRSQRGVPTGARGDPRPRPADSHASSTRCWPRQGRRRHRSAWQTPSQLRARLRTCANRSPTTSESSSTLQRTPRRSASGVDPDLAERILHPVLDNACRYARAHVRVSLARSDGVVVFSVSDDGPGVGVDEAESIFEPAMRGTAGRRAGPSAGLGLALARRLARSASRRCRGRAVARRGVASRSACRLPDRADQATVRGGR